MDCDHKYLSGTSGQAVAQRWVAALAGLAGRLIARQRIEDMFSIIRDFPDSRPAVLDLQIGLATEPALQHHFVSTLRAATRKRLLQAGKLIRRPCCAWSHVPACTSVSVECQLLLRT